MKTRYYAHCSFKYQTFFGLYKENPVLQWQGKQLHALFIFLFQFDFNTELTSFLACTKTRSSCYLKCSAPLLHLAQVAGFFMKFEHHKMRNFFTSSNFQTLTGSYSYENWYFSPNPSTILLISLFLRQAHCLKHILTSGLINFDKSAFTKKAPN